MRYSRVTGPAGSGCSASTCPPWPSATSPPAVPPRGRPSAIGSSPSRDVTGSDAGFALGTQGIGSAVVLNVIFWLSLVAFLVTHGFHVPSSHHGGQSQSASILVIVAAGVGVVLLGFFGGLFYLLTRGQERASQVIRRVAGGSGSSTPTGPPPWSSGWPTGSPPHGEPLAHQAGHRVGGRQLAARRGLPVGLRGRLQPLHLAGRPADGLRAGQHPGGHPHHPGRTRGGRVRAGLDDHRIRAHRRTGPVGRAGLPCRQFLAAHPLRRHGLRLTRVRASHHLLEAPRPHPPPPPPSPGRCRHAGVW
jgi:hypothetical protein